MLAGLIAIVGVLGLAVGSFLNVVIYRVPRNKSIVRPRSACPHCDTAILERDNIPVLSWLLLKGRCRTCGARISYRYPLVELACGILFAGAAARFGYSWALPALLVFLASLLALACIDAELLVLPKKVVYPSLVLVTALFLFATIASHDWHRLVIAGLCGLGWFVFFFVLNFVSPRALGFGDVRLAPMLGLGLGWFGVGNVLLGFFVANLVGAVVGLTLIAMKKMDRKQPIAYGIYLAIGAVIAEFFGPQILSALDLVNR